MSLLVAALLAVGHLLQVHVGVPVVVAPSNTVGGGPVTIMPPSTATSGSTTVVQLKPVGGRRV
jgi:hypothetical protein